MTGRCPSIPIPTAPVVYSLLDDLRGSRVPAWARVRAAQPDAREIRA